MKKLSLSRCTGSSKKDVGKRDSNKNKKKDCLDLIYEEPKIAEKIPIKYVANIKDTRYQERIIYESYKPSNLREMQDYIHFVLSFRRILPNTCPNRRHLGIDNESDSPISKETIKRFHPMILEKGFMNVEEILHSGELSTELMKYYNTEMQTRLPEQLSKANK